MAAQKMPTLDLATPTVEIVNVTPAMAKCWLAEMPPKSNRSVSKLYIEKYAREMLAGNWGMNGKGIVFNEAGHLIDGQHRLHAVVLAGRPVMMLVIRNASNVGYVDERPRSAGAEATIRGARNGNTLIATVRWMWRYMRGELKLDGGAWSSTASFSELWDMCEANPGLSLSVAETGPKNFSGAPHATLAFVHFMGSRTSPEKANRFIADLQAGANLPDGSPVLALMKAAKTGAIGRSSMARDRLCAMVAKSWLSYERGRPLKLLKLCDGEKFPRFRTNWPDPD